MATLRQKVDLRAILVVAFSLASLFLWVTASTVPPALLAVTCLFLGTYLGPVAVPSPDEEVVRAPYIPDNVVR